VRLTFFENLIHDKHLHFFSAAHPLIQDKLKQGKEIMSAFKPKNRKLAYSFIATSLPVVILLFIVICAIIYRIESSTQETASKMYGSEAVKQTESALKNWIDDQIRLAHMISENETVVHALQYPNTPSIVSRAQTFLDTIQRLYPYLENLPLSINLPEGKSINIQVGNETKTVKDGAFFIDTVGGKTIGKCNAGFSYIKALREGREYFISQVYPSLASGSPIFVVSAPVKDQTGKLLGAVIVAPKISYFTKLFVNPIKVGKTGYMTFFDDRGLLIGHPNKKLILNQDILEITRPITSKVINASGDVSYQEVFKGVEKFYTGGKVDIPEANILHNWYLLFTQDMDDIHSSSRYFLKILTWLALTFVLIYSLIIILQLRGLTRPINAVREALQAMAHGDMTRKIDYRSNNEIGQMAEACREMIGASKHDADTLSALAQGDWTVDIEVRSEGDTLRAALKRLVAEVGNALTGVNDVALKVNDRSGEIAGSSQILSEQATQTAAALEEINSSINEMASQTKQSADNATSANKLSVETRSAAENGSSRMQQMISAMNEIDAAGQNISKIIKTIDEIAFQTNLLALNAAVEAARAGQHGKGFAVVAEEVRNLAARSARAAAETAELIEGSVEKTRNGSQIAEQTAKALEDIVQGIAKTADLVSEIAVAGNQQASGIEQVTQGLGQIDQGVQQSTATAEESASVSQELAGQAAQLRQMLEKFVLPELGTEQLASPEAEANSSRSQTFIGWNEQG
jgi:methyl-accepting chemotaxis protein